MSATLETSHFEMSELNASARSNTAESKKKKREEQSKEEKSERMRERDKKR